MSLHLAQFLGFLLGLLLGSFLNVCISRIPRGESIVSPASHCPTCNHPIRWFDNIPLLSWLLLLGRCRDCKAKIPWRYPAVELATGIWFWLTSYLVYVTWYQATLTGIRDIANSPEIPTSVFGAIGLAILGFLLIGLIVTDWQTHRLPDAFTLTGIAIGLFLVCIQAIFLGPTDDQIVLNTHKQLRLSSPGAFAAHGNVFLTGPEALIFGRIAAVCGAALILLLVRWAYKALRHREGLGLGDVKLLAMIAAFLGFWPAVLTLFVGVLLASAYAILLLIRGRANSLTRLPLGSFLGIAGLLTALVGQPILAWYTSLF
jgi:leader peptidase (prepilin peptidase)/N-methyltransferase